MQVQKSSIAPLMTVDRQADPFTSFDGQAFCALLDLLEARANLTGVTRRLAVGRRLASASPGMPLQQIFDLVLARLPPAPARSVSPGTTLEVPSTPPGPFVTQSSEKPLCLRHKIPGSLCNQQKYKGLDNYSFLLSHRRILRHLRHTRPPSPRGCPGSAPAQHEIHASDHGAAGHRHSQGFRVAGASHVADLQERMHPAAPGCGVEVPEGIRVAGFTVEDPQARAKYERWVSA